MASPAALRLLQVLFRALQRPKSRLVRLLRLVSTPRRGECSVLGGCYLLPEVAQMLLKLFDLVANLLVVLVRALAAPP